MPQHGPSWDPHGYNDRLGIGLKSRAKEFRRSQVDDQGRLARQPFGPLPDSQWEGWFQALREAGVDNLADQSVGKKRGMFPQSQAAPSSSLQGQPMGPTFDPDYQSSAISTTAPMVDKEGNLEGYDVQERKPQNTGRFNPNFQSSALQGLIGYNKGKR